MIPCCNCCPRCCEDNSCWALHAHQHLCCPQIRPDRQTLLWSATWPREVQTISREFLDNPYQACAACPVQLARSGPRHMSLQSYA